MSTDEDKEQSWTKTLFEVLDIPYVSKGEKDPPAQLPNDFDLTNDDHKVLYIRWLLENTKTGLLMEALSLFSKTFNTTDSTWLTMFKLFIVIEFKFKYKVYNGRFNKFLYKYFDYHQADMTVEQVVCRFLAVIIELALKNNDVNFDLWTLTTTRSFDSQSLELFHLFKQMYKDIKGDNRRTFLQYSINLTVLGDPNCISVYYSLKGYHEGFKDGLFISFSQKEIEMDQKITTMDSTIRLILSTAEKVKDMQEKFPNAFEVLNNKLSDAKTACTELRRMVEEVRILRKAVYEEPRRTEFFAPPRCTSKPNKPGMFVRGSCILKMSSKKIMELSSTDPAENNALVFVLRLGSDLPALILDRDLNEFITKLKNPSFKTSFNSEKLAGVIKGLPKSLKDWEEKYFIQQI